VSASATAARAPRRAPVPRKRALWRDPSGAFSPLKTTALVLLTLPGLSTAVGLATNTLGGRPITEAIHETGHWAVRLLLITLAVTPVRTIFDWPRVVLLRRMLGVAVACYAGAHLLLYCVDQKWRLGVVASEIALRNYLTIGFVTLLGLLALAATSTDGAMRRMGTRWKVLHRLIFALTALALVHYYLQSKANVAAAVLVSGLYVWELLWRAAPKPARGTLRLLAVLAVAAALATACMEAAWYGSTTRINPARVLAANLDLTYPTVAIDVLLIGAAALLAAAVRKVRWRRRGTDSAMA